MKEGLERIRCRGLENRLASADAAARLIEDGMTVAVSGFTPAGNPKAVPLALAEQVKAGRKVSVTLLTGASTGQEIDSVWSTLDIISRRYPYITSKPLRDAINGKTGGTEIAYADQHLGMTAQNARYGFYGEIDLAIVEAAAITEEGGIVPTTALGCTQTYIDLAKKVIVEINLTQPAALEGLHDVYDMADPPLRAPIPLSAPGQRIGRSYIKCPPEKIAAIVVSHIEEKPRPFAAADENSARIAGHIVKFLEDEAAAGRLSADKVPLQSGVGSVANAVLLGLKDSAFTGLRFYSEVIQDGLIELMDCGKAVMASGTSLSLSEEGLRHFLEHLDRYKDKVVLRDSEISNSAEVIRRLGVISMNTAIEADIYGNINSSHMSGTDIYNGIGGSGDYARNASLTIFMTNSTAKDGRISSIVPMVTHTDHTEHDVDVIVTEQGLADLRGKAPKERARLIIANCAHPDYRPQLTEYFEKACRLSANAQTPHILGECFSFHQRLAETGSMRKASPADGKSQY